MGLFGAAIQFHHGPGRRAILRSKEKLDSAHQPTVTWSPQSVIANLMKTSWQDMLQKASYEFLGFKSHAFPLAITGILIAKGDLTIFDGENPVVGQGDTMHVAAQIVQDLIHMSQGWFTMNYPRNLPNRLRNGKLRLFSAQEIFEQPTKDLGEGFDRNQIVGPSGFPLVSLKVHSPGGNQAVNMGMIVQGSAPGMQYTEHAD
jgi:hypothetical protein